MAIAWKAWAFFRRDLLTDISYKVSFAFQILDVVIGVGAFFFLARVIGDRPFESYEPFAFILVGMAVNGYMTTSMACFSYAVRGNQPAATLKAVLATQTSPLAFMLFSSTYPMLRAAVDAGLYLLAGAVMGVSLSRVNVLAVLILFLLSVAAFSSIGICSATFTLLFKRGDPLLWLFGGLSWLLGGVFYPVHVLPPLLKHAAQLLPITHALEGMRAALLIGAPLRDLMPQIGILALFALLGLPLSLLAFDYAVRRAKVTGSLSHY